MRGGEIAWLMSSKPQTHAVAGMEDHELPSHIVPAYRQHGYDKQEAALNIPPSNL